MDKFDTLVESTLKGIYYELFNPANTTQLNGIEKAAVDDAVDTTTEADPNNPASSQQKTLADLAKRRRTQLQQVAPTATSKLQRQVSQPLNQ